MIDEEVSAKPKRCWWESPWIAAVVSLLACVLASATWQLCRFTLEPLGISHVNMALFLGTIIGGLVFFFFVGPCQLLIVLVGRWRKLKARTVSLLMLIPASVMVYTSIDSAISRPDPAREVQRFVDVTGVPWPTDAKMLIAEHGWGLQDKRHLWLFEGTPEQFNKLVRDRGWFLQDGSYPQGDSNWMPVKKAVHYFSKDSQWSAHEIYFWAADKEAVEGPFGPGFLITDKEHRRWCVWWDGI